MLRSAHIAFAKSLLDHQKLREIPLDPLAEQAALLILQEPIQRMCVRAVDVDLGEQRERYVVVG